MFTGDEEKPASVKPSEPSGPKVAVPTDTTAVKQDTPTTQKEEVVPTAPIAEADDDTEIGKVAQEESVEFAEDGIHPSPMLKAGDKVKVLFDGEETAA